MLDTSTGWVGTHSLVNIIYHGILHWGQAPYCYEESQSKQQAQINQINEVTWGAAMSGYILSCGNIKPEGWITIKKEALAFTKVNSCCNVSVLLYDTCTSTRVNDDEHECGNLIEASDDAENEEEVSHNRVQGITQGDESEEMEDVAPCDWVWGITQGDELPRGSEGEALYNDYYQE